MKKIIITGINGQDGRILSKLFTERNHIVYGIVNNNKRNYNSNIKILKSSLFNQNEIINCLKKIKPDYIYHLASVNKSMINSNHRNDFYEKNMIMSLNLINAYLISNSNAKFIFASSIQAYDGYEKNLTIDENTIFKSNSYYGNYKKDISNLIISLNKQNKNIYNAILFNHDSIYRSEDFLFKKIINEIKNKKNLITLNNINIIKDFSHAEDICTGLYLMAIKKLKRPNYILSSGKSLKIKKILDKFVKENKLNIIFRSKSNKKALVIKSNPKVSFKDLKWKLRKNINIALNEMFYNTF